MGKFTPESPNNLMVKTMVSGEDFPVNTNPMIIISKI
jgi:hypothetical protein